MQVSADVDTLEVTISATGDLLDSGVPFTNSLWLNCQIDVRCDLIYGYALVVLLAGSPLKQHFLLLPVMVDVI